MKINCGFNIDKVICDINVRYYIDCIFSKNNGKTWEEDFEDNGKDDEYVQSNLPCMEVVTYLHRNRFSGKTTEMQRKDWCPVIDVNEGMVLNWTPGFVLKTHFKVCDQGVYVYSNQDESQQIVSTDCGLYYVPSWLDVIDDGYGCYIYMDIDGDGYINNWNDIKKKLEKYTNENLDCTLIKSHVNVFDYI